MITGAALDHPHLNGENGGIRQFLPPLERGSQITGQDDGEPTEVLVPLEVGAL